MRSALVFEPEPGQYIPIARADAERAAKRNLAILAETARRLGVSGD